MGGSVCAIAKIPVVLAQHKHNERGSDVMNDSGPPTDQKENGVKAAGSVMKAADRVMKAVGEGLKRSCTVCARLDEGCCPRDGGGWRRDETPLYRLRRALMREWSLSGICCYTSPEDLDELALCARKLTPAPGQEAHRHS
jgi:hypothetical protein